MTVAAFKATFIMVLFVLVVALLTLTSACARGDVSMPEPPAPNLTKLPQPTLMDVSQPTAANVSRLTPTSTSADYFSQGIKYHENKEYNRAIVAYSKAIELDPDHHKAYHNRGLIYSSREDFDKALADFDMSIQLNPDDPVSYHVRGKEYGSQRNFEKALADFNRAIFLNPNDEVFYRDRGLTYAVQEKYSQAIADFSQAIELNPNDARIHYIRGLSYAGQGSYDQALSNYNRAIELNPDYPEAQESRRVVLGYLSKPKETVIEDQGKVAWYEGGTLHHSTAMEWLRAAEGDRLATSADWVAAFLENTTGWGEFKSMDQVKPYAKDLQDCVDAAVYPEPVIPNQATYEIAAACAAILNW